MVNGDASQLSKLAQFVIYVKLCQGNSSYCIDLKEYSYETFILIGILIKDTIEQYLLSMHCILGIEK